MKTSHSKYYVLYVEGCTPKMKSFTNPKSMNKFKVKFLLKHQSNLEDNWIDRTFYGQLLR